MENMDLINKIVSEVMKSMGDSKDTQNSKDAQEKNNTEQVSKVKITSKDYPLAKKRSDLIKTKTGKNLDDINMENVINGKVVPDDIKITPEVLLYQAQVAESVGRNQFAQNLKRAAELTRVPDDRVMEIYNALRPYRSTKQQLLDIAKELEEKYNAKINASLVREACEVYEKRGRLKA
ncbi:diol dehydratase small subunit [Clostridium sp. cel8]|jgi:propanediol dehydratase small subunit|uniref:diol dehydratase small subunit n=1 Tax=unclassified Clostridium TaxID=2614128 RepID=UPI0015F3DDDA|nr:diol dehydratase small subunit [Clostridium sp. cel8]MBA5850018.1 diol dehydratase small subunit [Clostridium sp. cel8]